MKGVESIHIRLLEEGDAPSIAAAFHNIGWNKPETQYERYFHEQLVGNRTCFVATFEGQFAGYVTVNWQPTYAGFAALLQAKLLKKPTVKIYPGFPHGMLTTYADRINPDLLEFVRS